MATRTPYVVRSVTVSPGDVIEVLRDGQSIANAIKTDALPTMVEDGTDYVGVAWDRYVDKVLEEAAPELAEVLLRVTENRLPWTWEPER